MNLWKIEGENQQDGRWDVYVRCDDPFEAMRRATAKTPWDVLEGLRITAVIDFIDDDEVTDTNS